jgi:hypothetical protein
MPKNSIASGISEIGGTDRNAWISKREVPRNTSANNARPARLGGCETPIQM